MKLTKRQIAKIKNAWRNAIEAEIKAQKCAKSHYGRRTTGPLSGS